MKLTPKTIEILKNFGSINSNLKVDSGSEIATISTGKNVIAIAKVEEEFDTPFAFADVTDFLKCFSLVGDPDIEFTDKAARLNGDRSTIVFTYASPAGLKTPDSTVINEPEFEIQFELSEDDLSQILKASSLLKHEYIVFTPNDGDLVATVKTRDEYDSAQFGNSFSLIVSKDIPDDANFEFIFESKDFKVIPDDYTMSLSSKKISKLESSDGNLTYYIAMYAKSSYTE